MYVYTTILPRVQRVQQHTSSTSVSCMKYDYIASRTTCKTTYIVYFCFIYEYTTILPREQRAKQHTSSTSIFCMSLQLYYLVYKVCNNTHRLRLFYVCVYNYITSCTTCKTTHIVYVCFMYEHTTKLPREQRVKHTSSTSVLCKSIQLYYLVYNNTHRLHLLYVFVSNYIASCTTCRTTHIVYICYIYV